MGKGLGQGSLCLRNSAVGHEMGGWFMGYFAKGLGQLGIWGAAVDSVVRTGCAFLLPFPLGAWRCFPCGNLGCGGQTYSFPPSWS